MKSTLYIISVLLFFNACKTQRGLKKITTSESESVSLESKESTTNENGL